jgi:hypothetical protein
MIEEQFVLVSPQHPGDFGDASPEQPRPSVTVVHYTGGGPIGF